MKLSFRELSFRAWFLIVVACVAFHFSVWGTVAIVFGYEIAEYLDHWRARKAREEVFEDALSGWEPSADDKEYEDKAGLTRVRLTGKEQIIVTRIAEMLLRVR